MSSNPYGQGPNQSGNYEDYSQGYSSAPQPPYGQQPSAPYSQPSAPGYGQPNYEQPTYGQPAPDPYGQPSYGQQPYTQQQYGQAPGYGQQYAGGLAPYTAVYDTNPRPSVSMVQAVKLWLKNWKNFSGRASRSEYWWVYLALAIVMTVLDDRRSDRWLGGRRSQRRLGHSNRAGLRSPLRPGGAHRSRDRRPLTLPGHPSAPRHQPERLDVPDQLHPVRRQHHPLVLMAQASNPAGARFDDAAQPLYGPESI